MLEGACSPIALGYWSRYAVWCANVPRCEPMPLESFERYFLTVDEISTKAEWLGKKAGEYVRACETEDEEIVFDLVEVL